MPPLAVPEKSAGGVVEIAGKPFGIAAIPLPVIPEKSWSIADFGAQGDGLYLNTEAIQQTISAAAAEGGGRVIIPAGIWLSGPIRLESRIELALKPGALLLFSRNHELYPIIQAPTKGYVVVSPIYGFGLEDVAITGEGIIDGAGESWRPVKKFKTTANQWKALVQSGGVVDEKGSMWWPSKEAMEGETYLKKLQSSKAKKEIKPEDYLPARDYLRPYMISLIDCRRVLIEGVTVKNSPKFALCPAWCEQLVIRDVKVNNEWWAQNGDGIDISSCRTVLVEGCTVTAGDDGICMKSSDRRGYAAPTLENVIIRDCIVYHGHGGFVIGSNTDGEMRNILVENCTFIGTDVGLRFKSARDRGGVVENIRIKKIFMREIAEEAIGFDAFYEANVPDTLAQPVAADTPIFRRIEIDSIYCIGAARAIAMTGLPEMPIQEIRMRHGLFVTSKGADLTDIKGISLEGVRILPAEGPALRFRRSSGIEIDGVLYNQASGVVQQLDSGVSGAGASLMVPPSKVGESFQSPIWRALMKRKPAWYGTPQAAEVAGTVLLYQCACGGWPKNIDMTRNLTMAEKAALSTPPPDTLATIDNGATWSQLFFLARMIAVTPEPRLLASFNRGMDYLFTAQYANGGWPQFFPLHPGYYSHITYNDDAMVGVLTLLQAVAAGQDPFPFVDAERRSRAARAVAKGVECILATQVKVDGKLTAWCAQHDEKTLQPAPARAYELVSLSGDESVGIVRFLMKVDPQTPAVIAAVRGAIGWFEQVRIKGIRIEQVADTASPAGFNAIVVPDSTAPPMWARFYLIGSNRPFFSDRDGKIYYNLAEISSERRNEYAWLGYWPQELLEKDYPAWLAR
jgi:DNA sulfur modification protein DndE